MVRIFHVNERLLPGLFKVFVDLFDALGCAFLDEIAQIVLCALVPGIYREWASVWTLALCQDHWLARLAG